MRSKLPRTFLFMMIFRRAVLLAASVVALAAIAARAGDGQPGPPQHAVLNLASGSFAAGELRDSTRPGVVRWQASGFVSPFEFPVSRVNAIHWPPPAAWPKPVGDLCFELAGGDVLFGSLAAFNGKEAVLDVPRVGRLHVESSRIRRIYPWRDGSDLIYLGPNGLNGWRETVPPRPPADNRVVVNDPARRALLRQANIQPGPAAPEPAQQGWHEEAAQLLTEQEGASIQGDFGIPARASIEFELSWKTKPDFVLALGTSDKDDTLKHAFRFEAWGGDLVIQRELEKEADLAVVQEVAPGPGRTHLHVYLDQPEGQILVFSEQGRQLASLKVGGPKSPVLPGIYLANLRGDLRLESLRIARWSGDLPREVKADQSRIHRSDGSIVYGQVTGFDAATKEFLIRSDSGESRIKEDKISTVFVSPPVDEQKPRSIRAAYLDGTRLSGDLDKVENGTLVMTIPGIKESLRLPLTGLRSLVVLKHPDEPPPARDESTGRLELDGLRLPGKLVDGREQPGSSCLTWRPLASETASPLKPGVSGRIIYKEPPPPAPPRTAVHQNGMVMVQFAQQPAPQPPQGVGNMVMRFAAALAEHPTAPAAQPTEERRSLFLRDGDVIPSVVTRIDADGVWFRTSLSASTFVAHDKVKAVELAAETPNAATVRLTKTKRDRLLTLPRMQKASPPTHLIRSKNGDYLRGRVSTMDDKNLHVEVRLDDKEVPRDRVSRIIWLHPDELDPSKKPAQSAGPNASTRVQALRNDGVRLTFLAEKFAGTTLSGKSDVLGPCQVAVRQVDQLLIGQAIEQAAAQLVFQQWKLKNAPEPKYVTAGDESRGEGGDSGTESPLVGKPAPDFELELVGGKKFHLADSKGQVVVLDFWATWCGPCLQAMPQVERATAGFKDKNVRLVAVNLQETAAQVTALLERQKLELTVALDRDGVVADKYKAVAIPQTVIIDREGKVARVFVGGGPHFEDQVRDAIKSVLAGDKPKELKK
ncbi:MAG: TlpA family protein disulfide reductase [Isosphaerales bacterium]